MRLFTEKEILEDVDCPDWAEEFSIDGGIYYKLSDGENQWLDFVRGRYSIADYIDDNTDSDGLTRFDTFEFSKALDDDCGGFGKAVCLSHDTALQKIFFYGYMEPEIPCEEISQLSI